MKKIPMLVLLVLVAVISVKVHATGKYFTIAFKDINLQKGERIESIKVEIKSGFLKALRSVPKGWELSLKYEEAGIWSLIATTVWGSARTEPNSLADIIVIEKDSDADTGLLPAFKVECTLFIVSDVNDKERTIKLSSQQLILKEGNN